MKTYMESMWVENVFGLDEDEPTLSLRQWALMFPPWAFFTYEEEPWGSERFTLTPAIVPQ